ncbi:MAG: GntR family transcriptional regulator [Firmicutes bacterium]|nr:GntR family transcriptional regulator [Bacillota bacterium]
MKLIERYSLVPIYHQVKEFIRSKIESGEWLPGYKIPSEEQLAQLPQPRPIFRSFWGVE